MRDENCIFCKIIAGEIPSNTIYEDDEFKVVLDVSPASKGHALILPKNHYADLYEIDENVAADAMKLAKKLAIHMTDVLKCEQSRSGRTDSIPFPYAPDPKIPQCKEQ